MDQIEQALSLFRSGFNCAQAVLSVFCEKYGIDKNTAAKLSCGLGGGVRSGEICGAVTGAVLVIGAKRGHCDPSDTLSKEDCYKATVDFTAQFKTKNSTLICRELLGCDTSTPQGLAYARENNLFRTTCESIITDSITLLQKMGY